MNLLATVCDVIKQFPAHITYWIAYSGGLDSHVLLSICKTLRDENQRTFRAIHINHGLSPNASEWSAHCRRVCAENQIDYIEEQLALSIAPGESLEAYARSKRYERLAHHLKPGDVLLTAHHQDDQAETVLLQLFRGAGPKGLSAMPLIKPIGHAFHARPMLSCARDALKEYALTHQLTWIEDESNHNTQLTRNFLRHTIFPLLKTRWPSINQTIARSAMQCNATQSAIETWARENLLQLIGSKTQTLSCKRLLQHDEKMQRLLLRTWIKENGYPLPNAKKLFSICQNILIAKPDRSPAVSWSHVIMRRFRDDLYLMPNYSKPPLPKITRWDMQQPLQLTDQLILHPKHVIGFGINANCKSISVRFRQGGEIAYLPNRTHRPLKKLFLEWQIPPWQRDQIPLIFSEEILIAAVHYFINPDFTAKENEPGIAIECI